MVPKPPIIIAPHNPEGLSTTKKGINGALKHKWLPKGERARAALSKEIGLDGKAAYELRKAREAQVKIAKETDAALKAEKAAKLRVKREKQRVKLEAKQAAELKAVGLRGVHIIKDTTKLRKWSKKAQKQLTQMPADLLESVYGIKI